MEIRNQHNQQEGWMHENKTKKSDKSYYLYIFFFFFPDEIHFGEK